MKMLKEMFRDLVRINHPVAESDISSIIPYRLPMSLWLFVIVLQANKMKYEELRALMESEVEKCNSAKPVADTSHPVQPAVRISNNSDCRSSEWKKYGLNVTCWYCDKCGHVHGDYSRGNRMVEQVMFALSFIVTTATTPVDRASKKVTTEVNGTKVNIEKITKGSNIIITELKASWLAYMPCAPPLLVLNPIKPGGISFPITFLSGSVR